MAPFAAGHTIGDTKAAVKFRGISDENPTHITEAANRVNDAAQNLGLNVRNQKQGDIALKSAQTNVDTEFKSAVDTIANSNKPPAGSGQTQAPMPQDVQNALARAQAGLPISDSDTATLKSWSGTPGAVDDLVRLGGVSRSLNGVSKISNGLSSAMERQLGIIAHPVNAAVGLGAAHLGGFFGYTPGLIAGVGSLYAGARFNDAVMGNRSRANAFTRRFADDSGVPQLSQPPQAPQGPQAAPQGPQAAPGGPQATPPSPGLATLNAMASPTPPPVPPPTVIRPPWGARNQPITGPQVPQMAPPAEPFNGKQFAPDIKSILANRDYLAKVQANSAEPPQAPEQPYNASGLRGGVQDALKARAYADLLRQTYEASQVPQAAPEAPPEPPLQRFGPQGGVSRTPSRLAPTQTSCGRRTRPPKCPRRPLRRPQSRPTTLRASRGVYRPPSRVGPTQTSCGRRTRPPKFHRRPLRAPPGPPYNASGLRGGVQDALKGRAYADLLRQTHEASQVPQAAPEATPGRPTMPQGCVGVSRTPSRVGPTHRLYRPPTRHPRTPHPRLLPARWQTSPSTSRSSRVRFERLSTRA